MDSFLSAAILINADNTSPCSLKLTCFLGISCVTLILSGWGLVGRSIMHPWARFRRDVNMTQAAVGATLNIDRLSVIRYEQGMFGHLSDELVDQLTELYKVDPDLLIMEYRGYQRLTRLEFKEHHQPWQVLTGYTGRKHPLIYYRLNVANLSRNGLCKGLCLDYGPVSNYEANKARSLPVSLKIASEDMGWDWAYLEGAVSEWRSSGRSSIK